MSKIEWCDLTINPVVGCSKISAGCKNCYAEKMANRLKGINETYKDTVGRDAHWTGSVGVDLTCFERLPKKHKKVFVCSMGDLFYGGVPEIRRIDVLNNIRKLNNHTFLILTKRPARMKEYFNSFEVPDNLWIGATCENQAMADLRIPLLLSIPAKVRFVSVEPMLEQIDILWSLRPQLHPDLPCLDWVICGAETGTNKRPMAIEWACDLQEQCKTANIPFFFKKDSDGVYPEGLRREFPL